MKILHVESGLNSGGQEYRTLAEVRWLRTAGHSAWIACNPDSEVFQQGLAAQVPVLPLTMRATFSPRATWQLYHLVRQLGCDLVHTHSPIDAWIAVPLRLAGVPVVRTRHITNPIRPTFFRTFCYRYGCDHLIPTAEVIRERLEEQNRIPRGQMTVIGEGADLMQFHPNVDGSSFRKSWGADPQNIVFGCVGMLRPEKGQSNFIQAAAYACKQIRNARFVLIGDNIKPGSPMRAKYRDLIREKFGYDAWQPESQIRLSEKSPILMHGHADNIACATAALDVAVVPSSEEAQSRTAPEALCLGKPIIACRVGGLPEVVDHEKTGLLVPRKDPEALAEAMIRLAKDATLRKQFSAAAAEEGKKRFSLDARMKQTLDVYEKVLNLTSLQSGRF
jgi:glycosyltransferase involved in cell wall biosynthesis